MTRAVLRPLLLFLLTWFALATCASANETQTENANPGTTTWQLTTAALTRQIEGYASLTSVNVGGSISFLVSTNDSSYTMDFYRIGWYGGAGGREVLGPITLPGGVQPTPSPDAYGTFECNWATSYVLTVPTNWVSGVYLVKLTGSSGNQSYIQFVVREDSRNSVYLFQRSITTDQAYNNWPGTNYGGKSLYTGAVKVSFNRPYAIDESYSAAHDGAGFFPRWEINMVRWLEMNGYDVTYATNIDMHENPNLLLNHKGFLAVGHDEYWSWEMRQNVETARDAGVGLAFFSGNESYWQIRLEPSTINGAADRTQVAYKSLSDPTTNPCLITILWRQNTCKPSEQAFVGVESTAYNVGGNIVIADPSNWALAGTGLVSGQVIAGVLGYEVDGVVEADSPPGTAVVAHSPLPSGYSSDSAPAPAYPFSDMATYTAAASGATVFSVGTIQWSWTLDDWGAPTTRDSKLNTAAQRITQNILARLATDGSMPPAPPSNLLAIAGNAQVGLTWSGSAGATSYNVKRSTTNGGPYTTVASPTTTSYTDTGLNNGTTYYYVVVAVNSIGVSGNSNQASATPATTPPPAPSNLVATAGNAQISVSWTASTGATSYNVKRSTANGGPYTTVGTPTTTSYTDSGLINGTTYYYVVSAVNSAGASSNSNQASATPIAPPTAPSNLVATAGNTQVSLSWSGSAGATSYKVKRSTSNGGPYTTVASPTATSYADSGLNNGTTYYYVVTAANAGGESGNSNQASATPAGPPSAPSGLAATAGNAQIALSWTGSVGATSYNVKRSTTNGGPYTTVGSSTTTSYTDMGVINGTTYYYVVSAVNSIGASGNSDQAAATPAAPAPTISLVNTVVGGGNRGVLAASQTSTTNMNLSAGNLVVITLGFTGSEDLSTAPTDTAGNTYAECCFTQNSSVATTIWYAKNTIANSSDAITVHFNSSTGYIAFVAAQYSGADASNPLETHAVGSCTSCTWVFSDSFSPASSRNLNVAAMNSSASAVYGAALNYTKEATSPGPAPTLAMEDLTNAPAGSQTTSLGGVNGGAEILVISVASFKAAGNTAPAAPSNLVATAGNAQVGLSWNGSTGATSYNVKRSTTNGGPYTAVASSPGTTYTDSGLNNGTTYYYVVTAANAGGESSNSNQASATPVINQAPSVVSVTPSSGSGSGPQTFSYVYSDTLGYQNIYLVQTILNATATWPGSCGTMYITASSSLYLMKDNGSGWLGPVTIGQAGTLQNSQCTLDAGASSASGSGTNLTVNVSLTFQPGFTGLKNNFMIANDVVNNVTSGLQNRGTWTPSSVTAPSAVSVTPNSGSGSGPQTFSYVYSDTSGYQNIYLVQTILSTTPNWPGSCGTMYITASSSLYLMKDDGSGWLGPVTIGQPGTLQNSQCTLDAGASSASGSGTNLTVNLTFAFQPGFTGLKNNFMIADDVANNLTSGFQNRGTWTPSQATAPSAVSVTPNSGSGSGPQTFSYVYSDTAGYQNIYLVQTVLNTTATWPGSCGTMYITASSSLYLMNDNGSSWLGPVTIGQPGTLQNSQCTLNAGASSTSGSGNNLTVNLALTFQPGFTGLKNNFMIANDVVNNVNSGLQNRGTWTPSP